MAVTQPSAGKRALAKWTLAAVSIAPRSQAKFIPDPKAVRSFLARRRVAAVIVDPANPREWPKRSGRRG